MQNDYDLYIQIIGKNKKYKLYSLDDIAKITDKKTTTLQKQIDRNKGKLEGYEKIKIENKNYFYKN